MTHNEKLKKCLDEKDVVEIIAEEKVTGVLSEIGDDYVAIVHAIEREITETVTITEGADAGKTEEQIRIQLIELETIILLKDIHAVSRIIRKRIK